MTQKLTSLVLSGLLMHSIIGVQATPVVNNLEQWRDAWKSL